MYVEIMSLSLSSYKGTRDIYPEDMRLRQYIFNTWRSVVESYGYEEYDAPTLEPLELYAAKSGEEIVNEQTYTFTDRGDRKVAIRPEMTPSIARMVAARRQELPYPARLYSISNFMRYERPQKGREREFWQLNVDIFGVSDVEADTEIISLSDKILKAFGATPEMYTIRINDRQLINYIMRDYLGLNDKQALFMIKLFDRRGKISQENFNAQATEIFGENNATDGIAKIAELLNMNSINSVPNTIKDSGQMNNIFSVISSLKDLGIDAKFDVTLMRGFDYYTGTVFEVFDNSPENNRAMFGGGRYDGLIGLFGVDDLSVVGVAPGETTMTEFLRAWDLIPELKPATDLCLIALTIGAEKVADELRGGGLNVAIDFTKRKIDKQIKSAVKMNVPYLLFVGEDEIASGQYNLKNVSTGEEERLSISEIINTITKWEDK